MAVFNKPQFNTVWAASGDKVAPEVSKISIGWVVEIPPHQYANWLENRRDEMLAHLNQAGIPSWDSTVEYQAGKSYVQGPSTGVIYKCLITNSDVNPELDLQGNWEVAFQRSGESLLKAQNLADVPDKAQARTNLGIATTADYDLRYLIKAQNLADLASKPTARGNLDVYSKQEVLDLLNNFSPAGEVCPFATGTAPNGWLVCDGRSLNRAAYSRLFAAIGTRFGSDSGTTFKLPDLRGEFVRGSDLGRGADSGRVLGSSQKGTMVAGYDDNREDFNISMFEGGARQSSSDPVNAAIASSYGLTRVPYITGSSSTSYPLVQATNWYSIVRPRNVALLYCIRF